MSHTVTIDVKITNLTSLEKVAKTFGFKKAARDGFAVNYQKGSAYFGVSKQKDGSYEFKGDVYYLNNMGISVDMIKQEYAKEEILLGAYRRGLTVSSCKKSANGDYMIEVLKS